MVKIQRLFAKTNLKIPIFLPTAAFQQAAVFAFRKIFISRARICKAPCKKRQQEGIAAAKAKEPLNKSSATLSGPFAPTYWFENLEIHKEFLQFSNLNLETKSLADHSCDLIRGSLKA